MKDQQLKGLTFLGSWVAAENQRQLDKWGIQEHSGCEWLTITAEEFGEMAKAILEHHFANGNPREVVIEAIQTATLCLKIAEMYLVECETKEKVKG